MLESVLEKKAWYWVQWESLGGRLGLQLYSVTEQLSKKARHYLCIRTISESCFQPPPPAPVLTSFFCQPSNLCKGFKSCNDPCLCQAWGYHRAPHDTVSLVCEELQPLEFYFLQNFVLCHVIAYIGSGPKSATVSSIYLPARWRLHQTGNSAGCNPCIRKGVRKELRGEFLSWTLHLIDGLGRGSFGNL